MQSHKPNPITVHPNVKELSDSPFAFEKSEEIEIRELLRGIGRKWKLITSILVSCLVIGFTVAFLVTPTYIVHLIVSKPSLAQLNELGEQNVVFPAHLQLQE